MHPRKNIMMYIWLLGAAIRVLIPIIFLAMSLGCAPEHIPASYGVNPQPKPEPETNGPLIAEVKLILSRCNGCHALERVPAFDEWPIEGNLAKHQAWVISIRRSMGFDSGRPRTMPPPSSPWQPSPEQIATLQKWYEVGAPNE